MKINQLLDEIDLPKRYFSEAFIIGEKFEEEASKYLTLLDNCDECDLDADKKAEFNEKLNESKRVAAEISTKIIAVFESYEESNYKVSQELFDEVMEILRPALFISLMNGRILVSAGEKTICTCMRLFGSSNGGRYFRIRAVDGRSQTIKSNPNELFHIPMNKRAYSSNERFSLAGFPCLYLSTMLPLAWQECNYPSKYYYSEYQYIWSESQDNKIDLSKELKLLALYSPMEIKTWGFTVKYNDFEVWNEVICRYLKMYPLILACSFINQSGNTPYKQEYIISQMLMQWVKRNHETVQGIDYFSCVDMFFDTSKWCANNIVIPAFPNYENGISVPLREKFSWTMPAFCELPIVSKNKTERDRKFIYEFMEQINHALRVRRPMPDMYIRVLQSMKETADCLLNLMANDNICDMRLMLKILKSLGSNVADISRMNLLENIEDKISEAEDGKWSTEEVKAASVEFEKMYRDFTGKDNSVKSIIDKHQDLIWNHHETQPTLEILYQGAHEIIGFKDLLHNAHRLFGFSEIKDNEDTFNNLTRLAQDAGVPIGTFWEQEGKDDVWLRNHIIEIKSPILIERNNTSIYSDKKVKSQQILCIGCTEKKLKEILQK